MFLNENEVIRDVDGASLYKINEKLLQVFDKTEGCYYVTDSVIKSDFFLIKEMHNTNDIIIASSKPVRVSLGVYKRDVLILDEDLVSVKKYILRGYDKNPITYTNSVLMFGNKFLLMAYTLPTATPLWQYDLSELGSWKDSTNADQKYEVRDFIGIIDTSLFIKLNANEILVLDIQTGNVNERLTFINQLKGETTIERPSRDIPFFQTRYIVNQDKSIIQGLFLDLYYEISFKDGKSYTRVFGLKKEYEKWDIDPRNISKENVIVNDNLYFLAYEQGRFGILNTITKEIDYVSDPIAMGDRPNSFTQLKEIQVTDDKVYVLASDSTLHIFEKESKSGRDEG